MRRQNSGLIGFFVLRNSRGDPRRAGGPNEGSVGKLSTIEQSWFFQGEFSLVNWFETKLHDPGFSTV
jgi:hypothetical protein